jgi:oxygen-independent coproporphyrinogen-3 oxidase
MAKLSEQDTTSKISKPVSLYFHIPFCRKRCNYCDFNTFANMEIFIPDYVRSICKEIKRAGSILEKGEYVHTIYFGGGTPSILSGKDYDRIFAEIRKNFKIVSEPEISMEVNPGTIMPDFLKEIFHLGVNRLSIGMQSSNPEELRILGRIHNPIDVINTVKWARLTGFTNISLDLMFGLPEQSLETLQNTIEFALRLEPTHISLYSLSVEGKTPFAKWQSKGLLTLTEEDLTADMFEYAMAFLSKQDFKQYEISNWAKKGEKESDFLCHHNLQYWLNQSYIGVGAGAHSYYNHQRWENINSISGYIEAEKKFGNQKKFFAQKNLQELAQKTEMQETMFMGLRLVQQGVSNSIFQERFGKSITDVFLKEMDELLRIGLIEWGGVNNGYLRLTKRGILLGNHVFMRFVD